MRFAVAAVLAGAALVAAAATPAAQAPPPRTIVFSLLPDTETGIGLVRPDGSSRVIISRFFSGARWSPDGTRLVAHGYSTPLAVLDTRGRVLAALQTGGRRDFAALEWSPSGRWVAALLERCTPLGGDWCADLWLLRANGRGARRLASAAVLALGAGSLYEWSPDGRTLAYSGAPRSVLEGEAAYRGIVLLDARTGRTRTPEALRGGAEPTWSPGGRRIAFTRTGPAGTSDIYTVRRDGRGLRRLTQSKRAFAAEWSPDGAKIAFLESRGERFAVSVADLERTRVRHIAMATAKVPLVWSPDGRYLAWSEFVDRLGADHVLVARADGRGDPRPITEGVDPDWR